ncbi:MAG: metal-dependent transcriptional regulator [bacterium]|nr:metal-dependent transcriptional regulator [bacterium]MCP4799476.1 metal-dependent transcriptional regulator [bacterium]
MSEFDNMNLTESQEDYLEAIFSIDEKLGVVRSKDLAKELKVKSSSVTQALQLLDSKDLVNYQRYGKISLTDIGKEIAKDVIRRHKALRMFFTDILKTDSALADSVACKMEHAMPREIVDRLVLFIEYTNRCKNNNSEWLNGFGFYCKDESGDICPKCEQEKLRR